MMKSLKYSLLYGFMIWAFPFIVAVAIFPLRQDERPLFESIMPVAVALVTVAGAYMYFKPVRENHLREGIIFGLAAFLLNIGIDLLMFSWGPMKMSFSDYMKDIGITYLMIPVIIIGFAKLISDITSMKTENSSM